MAKEANATIIKLLGVIATISIVLGSFVYGYAILNGYVAVNCKDIAIMKPEIKQNTEHRLQDEVDTQYIKQEISEIKIIQKQILEEVRK